MCFVLPSMFCQFGPLSKTDKNNDSDVAKQETQGKHNDTNSSSFKIIDYLTFSKMRYSLLQFY